MSSTVGDFRGNDKFIKASINDVANAIIPDRFPPRCFSVDCHYIGGPRAKSDFELTIRHTLSPCSMQWTDKDVKVAKSKLRKLGAKNITSSFGFDFLNFKFDIDEEAIQNYRED